MLWVSVASSVAAVVKSVASVIKNVNSAYNAIYKGMQERKLLKLQTESSALRLSAEDAKYIDASSRTMAKILGFRSTVDINRLTDSPYLTLKILLSVYRRVRTLSEYEYKGKAHFTDGQLSQLPPSATIKRPRRPKK